MHQPNRHLRPKRPLCSVQSSPLSPRRTGFTQHNVTSAHTLLQQELLEPLVSMAEVFDPRIRVDQDHSKAARRAAASWARSARNPCSTSAVLVTPGCACATFASNSSFTLSVIRTVCIDTRYAYVSRRSTRAPSRCPNNIVALASFSAGATLIGSHAFGVIFNRLGTHLESAHPRAWQELAEGARQLRVES